MTLEVRCGAYLQAWAQSRLSTVTFSGLRARTWSVGEGDGHTESYNADVYVFAVLAAIEHSTYDPLDVGQWSLWVLPRHVVAATGRRSLRLSRVQALAGPPATWAGLAACVRAVVMRDDDPDVGARPS